MSNKSKFKYTEFIEFLFIYLIYICLFIIPVNLASYLGGLIFKLWNCYGYEADEEKSHVITDFIKMGFENKKITMLTDGTEERDFLYDEDCSEAIEVLIKNYDKFNSDDNIHITTFKYTKIIDIAYIIKENFKNLGIDIEVLPSTQKDNVQKNKKNLPDEFLKNSSGKFFLFF